MYNFNFSNTTNISGNVTVTLSGINPLTIKIKGSAKNEDAPNISFYLYYGDDATTSLSLNWVDASQLETNFGWGTGYRTEDIANGNWTKDGYTYTHDCYMIISMAVWIIIIGQPLLLMLL